MAICEKSIQFCTWEGAPIYSLGWDVNLQTLPCVAVDRLAVQCNGQYLACCGGISYRHIAGARALNITVVPTVLFSAVHHSYLCGANILIYCGATILIYVVPTF